MPVKGRRIIEQAHEAAPTQLLQQPKEWHFRSDICGSLSSPFLSFRRHRHFNGTLRGIDWQISRH
jgi:hypothetical protein